MYLNGTQENQKQKTCANSSGTVSCQLRRKKHKERQYTDRGQGYQNHHAPDKCPVPLDVDKTEKERPKRGFGDRHPNNGYALTNAFEQGCLHNLFRIFDRLWRLSEAIIGGMMDEGREEEEEYLHQDKVCELAFLPVWRALVNGLYSQMPPYRYGHQSHKLLRRRSECRGEATTR